MPDSTNRIILKIDFEGNQAIAQTVALKKELAGYKAEQEALTKKLADGKINQDNFAKSMEILNAQVRDNQRETRTVTKFIDDATRARTAEKGSLEASRAKLSELTAEYIKAGNPTVKQAKNIRDLSDSIKKQESALGDNRRNVGNYADGLKSLGGPIGNAVTGIQGFNTTLKANPILAVVGLIISLGSAFVKLQPVADFIKETLGQVNAVMDVLIERVKLFVDGNFAGAFSGIADAIKEASAAGKEYAKVQKEIEDRSQVLNIINSENSKQIAVLTAQLKDRTKTDKERLEIADEITAREKANLELNQANLKKSLDVETKKIKNLLIQRGVSAELLQNTQDLIEAAQKVGLQDDSFKKLNDVQVQFNETEKESLAITERVEVRRNAILEQSAAAREKEHQDNLKRIEKETKATLDLIDLNKKSVEEYLKELDKKGKAIVTAYDEQARLLNKANDAEIKVNDFLVSHQKDSIQKKLDQSNQSQQDQINNANFYFDTLITSNQDNISLQLELEQKRQEQLNQIIKTGSEERLQIQAAEALITISNIEGGINALRAAFGKSAQAQKAFAITQVAIDEARSISSLITSSTANPLNSVTFGVAGTVQFAAGLATLIANVAKVIAIINGTKDSFYEGGFGYTGNGNPHSESTNLGSKPYKYHKNEYIVPSKILNTPQGAAHVQALESMRISNPSNLSYLGGMADGGFAQRALSSNVDGKIQTQEMIEVFRSMPTPVVRITDIIKAKSNRDNTISVSEL